MLAPPWRLSVVLCFATAVCEAGGPLTVNAAVRLERLRPASPRGTLGVA